MKPSTFEQVNKVLTKPEGWTDEQCSSLECYNDGAVSISLWHESSIWQRIKFLFSGDVWLRVVSGETQPPVLLHTESPWQ